MKKIMVFVALLALVGCVEDSDGEGGQAEGCAGEEVTVEGASYCVYEGAVIVEEGFSCPPGWPHLHEEGGLGICSSVTEEPEERLREVVERFREAPENNGVEPENNGVEPDRFPPLDAACASPAPLQLNVEPLEAREVFVVLFVEGTDAQAEAEALSAEYGFAVSDVFTLIPAFAASLSQPEVAALRCYPPVQAVEQSRSDTPPPGEDLLVSGLSAECVANELESTEPPVLSVADLGAGVVGVTHFGLIGNCCTGLTVSATSTPALRRAQVTYGEGAEEACDCNCVFQVEYTLEGFSDGSWEIGADGLSATVDVNVE
jgi:hypothetical protein